MSLALSDINSFPYLNPQKEKKIALITGGNSGIGFYTVLQLYLHGYIVYIAGRSKSKSLKSIHELKLKSIEIRSNYTNEENMSRFLGELNYLEIDLSNLNSVIKAVETFKHRETSLHLLINNAGAMAIPYIKTQDDFEIQFQTNYISQFLLTIKLLPIMERTILKSPKISSPRIIYLNSIGHKFIFSKYLFNLNYEYNLKPNFIFTWIRYGIAKTSGIHFMKMLSLRNPKILSLVVHPGLIMNTNLFTYWTNLPIVGILFWCFFQIFSYFFGISYQQGSYEVLNCCLNPRLNIEVDNGKCYSNNGTECETSNISSDMDQAARTWIWTIRELNKRGINIPEH
ncbi:unnamed protein product [Candida verbasci]|uniref:NAD(P)-binding protein n=1 Tax=Candida verbasci TaxID=1227364 RepID=A0A9W4TV79_9ASCO|nr:unnamed protein product [Candida verbasci]